ncbi:MAG: GDSL-type esterase/lipase family protein, partial [Candidatus Latescibacteria bacterium]|nr:GDSL-type esterase/lipase family protein [Candidatus Latescibacterota bacterium]
PVEYMNKGIGANAVSSRSPGYPLSAKPSALERYRDDVIANDPDLFVCAYGLNDMRADMPLAEFIEDLRTVVTDVKAACNPIIVLTTVYYMTGWKSFGPYDRGSVATTEGYNSAIRALAAEEDCLLADVWGGADKADWLVNPDGVHANKVGNMIIANRVFEAIARACSGVSAHTYEEDLERPWTKHTMEARDNSNDPHDPWWIK